MNTTTKSSSWPTSSYVIGNGPDRIRRARYACWLMGRFERMVHGIDAMDRHESAFQEAWDILGNEEMQTYRDRGYRGLNINGTSGGSECEFRTPVRPLDDPYLAGYPIPK